ncbi:MAG: NAD-dependent epimerase/dehydratase family protein [Bryobacteraceae bacterium]|nr:NAD-dependent epimerase/dehydratase family protein [Bryobacteraceae bacterium]
MSYRGKCVLVTGGLGFIGSNLVIRLVSAGARVTVVDARVTGCGANPFNLAPVAGDVCLIERDIGDAASFAHAIRRADVVFNLAGEISHVHSMQFPERDLRLNTESQLRFLLACRQEAPGLRVVFATTRQVFGIPEYLPVDERHPIRPIDFNGIHKFAATQYHLLMRRLGELDAVALRLTNVYGPRMSLAAPCQGFLGNFFRRALQGRDIEVFGDGLQSRDVIFVDDVVDAFLLAGAEPRLEHESYNVGARESIPLRDIASSILEAAGGGKVTFRPFPPERKAIDIGSYATNPSLIEGTLGWRPVVPLGEGCARTVEYYRTHLRHYWDSDAEPCCQLPDHYDEEYVAVPARAGR